MNLIEIVWEKIGVVAFFVVLLFVIVVIIRILSQEKVNQETNQLIQAEYSPDKLPPGYNVLYNGKNYIWEKRTNGYWCSLISFNTKEEAMESSWRYYKNEAYSENNPYRTIMTSIQADSNSYPTSAVYYGATNNFSTKIEQEKELLFPEGFKILKNKKGKYTWKQGNYKSQYLYDTKEKAIEMAIKFNDYDKDKTKESDQWEEAK